jgi:hypothetical protein
MNRCLHRQALALNRFTDGSLPPHYEIVLSATNRIWSLGLYSYRPRLRSFFFRHFTALFGAEV